MAWNNTIRKEDKPFKFDEEDLVLIEYSNEGRLYLAKNRENILVSEDDFLAVSYIPTSDSDNRLPVVAVRCLGYTGKHFLDTCKWLDFNPNVEEFDYMPRYHEESVIKNISRDDSQSGASGSVVVTINPVTGEEETASSGGGYKPSNSGNDDNNSNSKPNNEKPNDNSSKPNNFDSNNNNVPSNAGYNSSNDSFFEELENQTKPECENVVVGGINDIFVLVKKTH